MIDTLLFATAGGVALVISEGATVCPTPTLPLDTPDDEVAELLRYRCVV